MSTWILLVDGDLKKGVRTLTRSYQSEFGDLDDLAI